MPVPLDRIITPYSRGWTLKDSPDWTPPAPIVAEAEELGITLGELYQRLHVSITDKYGSTSQYRPGCLETLNAVIVPRRDVSFQILVPGQSSIQGDPVVQMCANALNASFSEHARIALEALTELAPRGHKLSLHTASCETCHPDAGVREEAINLLVQLVRPCDLAQVRELLLHMHDHNADYALREIEKALVKCDVGGA